MHRIKTAEYSLYKDREHAADLLSSSQKLNDNVIQAACKDLVMITAANFGHVDIVKRLYTEHFYQ